jgi:hypothetical protein
VCIGGVCGDYGCNIGGIYYNASTQNPAKGCQTCQPATSLTDWSNVADGTICGTGQVCVDGACNAG